MAHHQSRELGQRPLRGCVLLATKFGCRRGWEAKLTAEDMKSQMLSRQPELSPTLFLVSICTCSRERDSLMTGAVLSSALALHQKRRFYSAKAGSDGANGSLADLGVGGLDRVGGFTMPRLFHSFVAKSQLRCQEAVPRTRIPEMLLALRTKLI